ncbi:AmmeMemoRadiSam system protein B [candidate division KSB1 bacterium]
MKKNIITLFFVILVISSVFGIPYLIQTKGKVRKPAVAGSWYPGDIEGLRKTIQSYLDKVQPVETGGEIRAVVSPHAGYAYSGEIAASAYKNLAGRKYETVVVIAPSHREYFLGCSVYDGSAYETPLGKIDIDKDIAGKLVKETDVLNFSDKGHKVSTAGNSEHSLEIQLPFLQVVLGDFKIVPIIMGEQNYRVASSLGNALAKVLKNKSALIVASSDLSHFHTYDDANALDKKFVDCVENYDYKGLADGLSKRQIEACGGFPVVSAMIASEKLGAKSVRITKYANSGDNQYGDKNRVVGYMGAVFYKSDGKSPDSDTSLSEKDRKLLFEIAWNSINSAVKGAKPEEFSPKSDILLQKRGAFVTIKKNGNLRGCIGYIVPVKTLYETVGDVARLAAVEDPRFAPVSENELKDLKLEISVLSPISQMKDPENVVVGKHGLIIKRGNRQGLLLPQVPVEEKWDRQTFIEYTCMKAGLPKDAWKMDGTEFFVFTAEVFAEEER